MNGKFPRGMALVQGVDGNFYGTTQYGGANCNNGNRTGCGVVFKVSPTGKVTRLYSFCSLANCADGYYPLASLVQANGKLHGTTSAGGSSALSGCGTVFEIAPTGKLTTLHTFNVGDACKPEAGLIQAANGNFYGTTNGGGLQGGGTVFEMTPSGQLRALYVFCSTTSCEDGFRPMAGLVQATDGNLYGTTSQDGHNCTANLGCGTVFKITPAGHLSTLYSFCSFSDCADGQNPVASLIQATNGNFYGTTSWEVKLRQTSRQGLSRAAVTPAVFPPAIRGEIPHSTGSRRYKSCNVNCEICSPRCLRLR